MPEEALLSFFDTLTVGVADAGAGAREGSGEGTGEGTAERLATLWRPFLARPGQEPGDLVRRPPAPEDGGESSPEPQARVRTRPGPAGLASAAAELNRLAVEHCPYPAVHSAVVTTAEGAIALPAPSGFGKSTFAAAACRAGAGYLSDEALVLAPGPDQPTEASLAGSVALAGVAVDVVPYPKPLALSSWSLAAAGIPDPAGAGASAGDGEGGEGGEGGEDEGSEGEDGEDGEDEGSEGSEILLAGCDVGQLADSGPLRHVLLPERGAGRPRLTPLGRPEGLAALLRLAFNHHRAPRRFLVTAAAALQGARVHRLLVGHPAETALLVLDTFGGPPTQTRHG